MKTHEITTSKGDFVVVDVSTIGAIPYVKLLFNNKLICEISEATEEDAKLIVDEDNEYGVTMYRNYATTSMAYYDEQLTAIDSLHSLLKSKGIDINNGNWYLFKKV